MTIKEIAQIAGVSVSTVSKIMNNKDQSIRSETREHVLKIAKEYNYKPYSSIITSSSGKTLCLGIIFRNASAVHNSISGMIAAASSCGYSILTRESNNSVEQELKNILALLNMHVDGIIWEPVSPDSLDSARHIRHANIPYFIINSDIEHALNIDFQQMGYLATEALIKARHSEIACMLRNGNRTKSFFQGYRQCLFDHNIAFDERLVFYETDGLPISKITNHIFSGIVVSHYAAAIQLYKAIDTLHYAIPHDLSLVSLKDSLRIKTDYPPISTLPIPYYDFGTYVVDYLIHIIEKKDGIPKLALSFKLEHHLSIDIPYNSRLKKVISLGSINIDNYMNFDQLPHTGKTVTSPAASIYPGGKCINEAIGIAKLGHQVSAIGRVGDDADADFLYEYIKDYPVDTFGIRRSKGLKTGQAYIFVQKDGDSMISIMSGANNAVSSKDIIENERLFVNASYCLIQTEIPMEAIIKASHMAKKYNLITVLKPSACSSLPLELLQNIDIISPNLDELGEICPGGQSLEEKAGQLLSYGIKTVIVTMGAQGCYLREKNLECRIPSGNFTSVDSSGAGDAFISALVSYLLYGYEIVTAAKIATYAAGLSTTRQGTTPALIDKDTLESFIRQKEPELLHASKQ